jgi:hypothetical protein
LHGTGGGEGGSSVFRLHPPVDAPSGASLVVKVVRRVPGVPPHHRDHWRREAEAYRSDWLAARLPPGLARPRCHAVLDTPTCVALVLQDVRFDSPDGRAPVWYAPFGRLLGRFNARGVDGGSADGPGAPEWLCRDFADEQARRVADRLSDVLGDRSDAMAWLPTDARRRIPDLVRRVDTLAAILRDLPPTLAHQDAFSRNVVARDGEHLLIDWAFVGIAPVGAEIAGTLAITAMHGDVSTGDITELEDVLLREYRAGLADAGLPMAAEDLLVAYSIAVTLRFARFVTEVQSVMHTDPSLPGAVAGRPLEEVLAAWTALAAHVVPHTDRALRAAHAT